MRLTREEVDDHIYEMLLPRLNQIGLITTNDAWEICKEFRGHETVSRAFRAIMATMIEQGKATRVSFTKWEILKANTKFTGSEQFQKYQ